MLRIALLAVVAAAAALRAQSAAFRTSAIFGDHMVLPASTSSPLHGFGVVGAEVLVEPSWGEAVRAQVGADGRWKLTLPAGGARGQRGSIALSSGAARQAITDIVFGDVWLASGQSNMEWKVRQCDGADEAVAGADLPNLRVFTVAHATSDLPADDVRGEWVVCTPERAPSFTAVGFFFAAELLANGKGPIGLVDSTWGGTVCQAWTRAEGLAGFPEFASEIAAQAKSSGADEISAQRAAFFAALRGAPAATETASATLPERWSQVGLGDFDGACDYTRAVKLPPELVGQDLQLRLGPIDDMDTVFWNGRRVAGSEVDGRWNRPRRYRIPAEQNRDADVELRIRVVDTGGEGGFTGSADQMSLGRADGQGANIALDGPWLRGVRAPLASLPPWPRSANGPNRPTVLWNGMIHPLLPFPFKGAIWYQGESNRNNPDQYARLFPEMITDWRRAMGLKLPFYFVQIAPYGYRGDSGDLTARLRSAQAAALALPRTGMAVTLDVGDAKDIHPRNKQPVGARLARHALAECYGQAVDRDGPIAKQARRVGDSLRVTFAEAGALKLVNGGRGFEVAGADGVFHPATAVLDGGAVVVHSDAVVKPSQVRYAWSAVPQWSLCDGDMLPAPPFLMSAR